MNYRRINKCIYYLYQNSKLEAELFKQYNEEWTKCSPLSLYEQEKILAELIEYQSEVFQLTVGSEEKAEETEGEK